MRRAPSHSRQRVHHQQGQRKHVATGKKHQSAQRKHDKAAGTARKQHQQKQAGSAKRNIATGSALAAGAIAGKGVARNLPVSKAVAGGASINGRVAVPKNLRPRLTVIRPPHVSFRPRLAPFVQRHWRHAFFWAAVAGIGYLTVPDLYYDRFYGCVNADDPDYGCAVDLLSSAALDEEQGTTRVRYPMPSTAAYRYSASVAPKPEAGSCNFAPFVERKWNHPFVWVQIPQTGNVTVPEDYYDRFYSLGRAGTPKLPLRLQASRRGARSRYRGSGYGRDGARSLVGGLPFSISLENPDCVVTKQRCLLAR
jgi:hypothetical protein